MNGVLKSKFRGVLSLKENFDSLKLQNKKKFLAEKRLTEKNFRMTAALVLKENIQNGELLKTINTILSE